MILPSLWRERRVRIVRQNSSLRFWNHLLDDPTVPFVWKPLNGNSKTKSRTLKDRSKVNYNYDWKSFGFNPLVNLYNFKIVVINNEWLSRDGATLSIESDSQCPFFLRVWVQGCHYWLYSINRKNTTYIGGEIYRTLHKTLSLVIFVILVTITES